MFTFTSVLPATPAVRRGDHLAHLAEWLADRMRRTRSLRSWYLQPFNIAMHISLGALACLLFEELSRGQHDFSTALPVLAAIIAATVYTVLNHLIIGEALYVGRSVPWKESGILEIDNVLTDLMMALTGLTVAALLQHNAWLLLPALSPSYLIYRGLSVPNLKRQASTDPNRAMERSLFHAYPGG
jgi:hypothetical protein